MKRFVLLVVMQLFFTKGHTQQNGLPDNFVYVKDVIPDIVLDIRYAGRNNFVGKPIEGYKQPRAILSKPAAKALEKVQQELADIGLCIKVFDAYRPQRAVSQFISWAKDRGDTLMKQQFYPQVEKKNLFRYGYIASRSGHSRGSTVDITLIDAETGQEVDMGGTYDFFGEISHHYTSRISEQQKNNRQLLKSIMRRHGFVSYTKEWWHYTYQPEPFPETYFDFIVK